MVDNIDLSLINKISHDSIVKYLRENEVSSLRAIKYLQLDSTLLSNRAQRI